MTVVRILISVVRILCLTTPQEFGVLLPPILFSVEVLLVLEGFGVRGSGVRV
jgi:hypothetical protein